MSEKKKAARGKASGATGGKPIHRRDIIHSVREPLGNSEKDQRIKTLLAKLEDQDALRIEAKDTQAVYRTRLKELKDEIAETRAQIKEGAPVDVECEEIKNFRTETVTIKRKDNGKKVSERAMDEDDKQLDVTSTQEDEGDDSSSAGGDDEHVAHA